MKKILLTALLIQGAYCFSQNLVLHYKLNDLTSSTIPANNLNLYGTGDSPIFVGQSLFGLTADSCVFFDAEQGYVSDFALDNQTWTTTAISVWYKSNSAKQGTIIQGAYLGFGLRVITDGYVQASFKGTQQDALESTVTVNDGQWHHLFAQNDGEKTYIYVDGILNASKPETLIKLTETNALAKIYIGIALNNAYDQKLEGYVDEVRIYSDTLSVTQINDLMNGVLSVKEQSIQRIQLYPNPTNDMINIQTDATVISSSIFNVAGNLVATFTGKEYSVSHLNTGIYFINVKTETGIAQHKFVKQ